MNRHPWLSRTSSRRVAIEAASLGLLLLLPFAIVFASAPDPTRWPVFTMAGFEVGLLVGLAGGLRLRISTGPRRIARDLAGGALLAASTAAGAAIALQLGLAIAGLSDVGRQFGLNLPRSGATSIIAEPLPIAVIAVTMGAFTAVGTLISFLLCRGVTLAWLRWDGMRRTKLRWALTNALLVASLIVAVAIASFLSASAVIGGGALPTIRGVIPADAPGIERLLAVIVFNYVPASIVLFLAPLLLGIVIVPPVALIAFPVLGRATRRLETLTTAAHALRAGDLSARTPVTGEDEIARLQADFNAMAADLERTLGELRAERDAVGRLLNDRRELVASVSHELRTPLATLRGYLDSTLEHWDGSPSATLHQDLEIMSAETDRLHRLVDDLFTLSRAEVGRLSLALQPAAVGPLLRRIVATAAPLVWNQGRVEIVADPPADLPPARVDPERLEQIVRNLITNAVRHTPPGGLILVSAERDHDSLLIQVRDTGEGIAPADLPHIWNRFYRAGNAQDRSGAGLGLALVKELTEAMGGFVTAESTPGEGSSFTIRLPLASAAARGAETTTPIADDPSRSSQIQRVT